MAISNMYMYIHVHLMSWSISNHVYHSSGRCLYKYVYTYVHMYIITCMYMHAYMCISRLDIHVYYYDNEIP